MSPGLGIRASLVLAGSCCLLAAGPVSSEESGSEESEKGQGAAAARHPNVLVVVADDLGTDWAPCYADFDVMPHVKALCERAVVFDTVWSNPSCTPTRASALTGRYTIRHRAGASPNTAGAATRRLRPEEVLVPEVLERIPGAGYRTAAFGKWHLEDAFNGGEKSPVTSAFQEYYGSLNTDPFFYPQNVNGEVVGWRRLYKSTAIVDDATAWLDRHDASQPWFLWVAFFNGHFPYHLPPAELHDYGFLEPRIYGPKGPGVTHPFEGPGHAAIPDARPYFAAMLQAMDTEIGRLLARVADEERETWIFFLGDNGSAGQVVLSDAEQYRFKGTVYEGGVRVPLIVAGPGVREPGRREKGLVNVSDLFATTIELAGGSRQLAELERRTDSVSLVPYLENAQPSTENAQHSSLRPWIYTERGSEKKEFSHAVRDQRFKLIVRTNALGWLPGADPQNWELYDLASDPNEAVNLFDSPRSAEAQAAARRLFGVLRVIHASEEDPFTDLDMEIAVATAAELGVLPPPPRGP